MEMETWIICLRYVFVPMWSTVLFRALICIFQEGLSVEQMSRYASPINPAVFPHLTIVLLSIGIFFMAWFFVYPFIYNVDDSMFVIVLMGMFFDLVLVCIH